MNKKLRMALGIFGIGLMFLPIWFLLGVLYTYSEICYEERAILLDQYFCNVSPECIECLCMEVYVKDTGNYETYYFAKEYELREDLKTLDSIIVRWCPTRHGYRIRGVWKDENE